METIMEENNEMDSKLTSTVMIQKSDIRFILLMIRMATLVMVVAMLTIHIRTMRMFLWEQSVTGGIVTTYVMAAIGLILCVAQTSTTGAEIFQIYLTAVGCLLFFVNSGVLLYRWRKADTLQAAADLLGAVGIPLRKQFRMKVYLSLMVSLLLGADTVLSILSMPYHRSLRSALTVRKRD